MNKSTLAIVVSIIASASVHAAEVYNKNGNKLDVYGKVKAMHYMSDYDSKDGDQSYVRGVGQRLPSSPCTFNE